MSGSCESVVFGSSSEEKIEENTPRRTRGLPEWNRDANVSCENLKQKTEEERVHLEENTRNFQHAPIIKGNQDNVKWKPTTVPRPPLVFVKIDDCNTSPRGGKDFPFGGTSFTLPQYTLSNAGWSGHGAFQSGGGIHFPSGGESSRLPRVPRSYSRLSELGAYRCGRGKDLQLVEEGELPDVQDMNYKRRIKKIPEKKISEARHIAFDLENHPTQRTGPERNTEAVRENSDNERLFGSLTRGRIIGVLLTLGTVLIVLLVLVLAVTDSK